MQSSGKWIEGIRADGSVEDAARISLEPRLATVIKSLPLAAYLAAHDVEHVHRLRVATRRAVAAVKLYRDWLPDKPRRWIKKRLQKIRRAAGEARDLDVLAARLSKEYGDRSLPVLRLIGAQRTKVQPHILKIADRMGEKDRFSSKAEQLLDSIDAPPNGTGSSESQRFRDWSAKRLAEVTDQFMSVMPDEQSDAVALHQFRISAKAIRYTIELVAPAFDSELREDVYPAIEELQERLGKVQDHVTAREYMARWADEVEDDETQDLLQELIDEEDRGLTHDMVEFRQWWTDDRVARVRQHLHAASQPAPAKSDPQAAHQT